VTVHSTQLGAVQNAAIGLHTIYTVPSGKRTIVKSVWLRNTAAAAQTATIRFNLATGAIVQLFVPLAASPGAGSSVLLTPWVVLNVGDVFQLGASATGIDGIASGAELSLV
jgi:hypothetical protein